MYYTQPPAPPWQASTAPPPGPAAIDFRVQVACWVVGNKFGNLQPVTMGSSQLLEPMINIMPFATLYHCCHSPAPPAPPPPLQMRGTDGGAVRYPSSAWYTGARALATPTVVFLSDTLCVYSQGASYSGNEALAHRMSRTGRRLHSRRMTSLPSGSMAPTAPRRASRQHGFALRQT